MAITIIQRPEGFIRVDSFGTADVSDFGGDALFTDNGHALVDGDVVYIESNIINYNGFLEVTGAAGTGFFLIDPSTNDRLLYVNSTTDVKYYATSLTHGWSCVHLPITYRLENNLYPTNSADSAANINSVQDANGFTVLQLSGSPGTVHSYDFLKLTVPNDTDLSGVYQIIEFISSTVMIINLQYDASNNFTSATAIKQYNNYTVLVRVYAGLNASHTWASQKPYELAATLEFTPDSDNEIFFSVNEILKSYIETRNNLVLGTLPTNIDFFSMFYIETAEKYDDSDGYAFGSLEGSFTSDQSTFEGVAVNSKLDFKNIHSGYLSEYLMTNNTAKFLTLFTIPVLFQCGDDTPDCYQDISFLNPDRSVAIITTVRKQFYLDSVLSSTVDDSVDEESGVIRHELEADCDYDRVDITLLGGLQLLDEPEFNATGNWQQSVSANPDWTISGGMASVIMPTSFPSSEVLYQTISGLAGNYRLIVKVTTSNGSGGVLGDWNYQPTFYFTSGASLIQTQMVGTLSGPAVGDVDEINYDAVINIPGSFDTMSFELPGVLPDSTYGATVNVYFVFLAITSDEMSETKQFRLECGCVDQEIRLTWLNNLAGFDYWAFTANKDHIREIQEVVTTKNNILPNWPKSYGADADTIRKQTKRVSNKAYTIRSQFLTADEADALAYIKSSILVQIINSRLDRRTVIVDSDSFIVRKDGDDTYEVAFNVSFTDDIAVQTL